MGAPTGIDVEALRVENEEAKKKIEELESTIKELQTKVSFISSIYFLFTHSFLIHLYSIFHCRMIINNLFGDWTVYIEVVFLVCNIS